MTEPSANEHLIERCFMRKGFKPHNKPHRWTLSGVVGRLGFVVVVVILLDAAIDGRLNWPQDVADWLGKSPAFEIPEPSEPEPPHDRVPVPEAKPQARPSSAPAPEQPGTDQRTYDLRGRVVRVYDGDTIQVRVSNDEIRVRLHGIDSPEKGQPYGRAAGRELRRLIGGDAVGLEIKNIDDYGRTVAFVYKDGININVEIVRRGYAWWYRRYARSDRQLRRAEEEARANQRGLWKDQNPMAPWEWRRKNTRSTYRSVRDR